MLVKHAARAEKNRVEIVRFQQMQNILAEQAARNITIKADAEKERAIREAMGKSAAILLEANATSEGEYLKFLAIAKGIEQIKEQLTTDYIDYLIAS